MSQTTDTFVSIEERNDALRQLADEQNLEEKYDVVLEQESQIEVRRGNPKTNNWVDEIQIQFYDDTWIVHSDGSEFEFDDWNSARDKFIDQI